MCGIVGAVSTRNIVPILVQGLQRLEYRGYDSCGVAVYTSSLDVTRPAGPQRTRSTARVTELLEQVNTEHIDGVTDIVYTHWATYDVSAVHNAHLYFSHDTGADAHAWATGRVALVYNDIIKNHEEPRACLQTCDYVFVSQTDTEVIARLMGSHHSGDLSDVVWATAAELHGVYAAAAMHEDEPHRVVGIRAGSPLILGMGKDATGASPSREHFLASNAMALADVIDRIVYLEEDDLVDLQLGRYWVVGKDSNALTTGQRPMRTVQVHSGTAELGPYRHYIQKEIFGQPRATADTLEGLTGTAPELFDDVGQHGESDAAAWRMFRDIDNVLILACSTNYYSGYTAKYWSEEIAGIPTQVEVANEYRYRTSAPSQRTLIVITSQGGETTDTPAALRHAQSLDVQYTLTVCNVTTSATVRECKLIRITCAGVEIGVVSTKAFATQLAGLFLLILALAQSKGHLSEEQETAHPKVMRHLPMTLQTVLVLELQLASWIEDLARTENALFLGRGLYYPIALEDVPKLREISYIHVEVYPADEFKHGSLTLVTSIMPMVTVASNNALPKKLKSNMQEVRARAGMLYVLADGGTRIGSSEDIHMIHMPEHYDVLSPLLHVAPPQLFVYHTTYARGTDADKPRNLVKSVTVE